MSGGITTPMLVANFCLAWTAFPAITNKVKTRLPAWSPVIAYRFYKMWQYGAERSLLDYRIGSITVGLGGANVTVRNISSIIPEFQNFMQAVSLPQNLNMIMQTTVGIADSAYTLLPMAVAKKFEVMGWVLNSRSAYDGAVAVNNFRKSMKNNPDIALDAYEDLLIIARNT